MRPRLSYIVLLCALLAAAPAAAAPQKPAPVKTKPAQGKAVPNKDGKVVNAKDGKAANAKDGKAVNIKDSKAINSKDGKAVGTKEDAALPPAADLDEGLPLPHYPEGARTAMGRPQTWVTGEEDTLLDIARHFDLGYVEMRAANPDIDAWAPLPGTEVTIPSFRLLPRAKQEGIVVNLAEMRLYYFRTPGEEPETIPIGIGRDGLMTPVGETHIERKVAGPTWVPTKRMRDEHPYLPESVGQAP